MNTLQHSTRWLGLTLACGIITFAASASAKKPPPPPPQGGLTYATEQFCSGLSLWEVEINDSGIVTGITDFEHNGYRQAFILVPRDGTYFVDDDNDGVSDLMQPLPVGPEILESAAGEANVHGQVAGWTWDGSSFRTAVVWNGGDPIELLPGWPSYATSINDAGVVALTLYTTIGAQDYAYIVVPLDQDLDGVADTWFADDDADGFNDLAYVVEWWDGRAIEVLDNLDVVVAHAGPGVSVVRPDFSDPDGDGNPWMFDVGNWVNGQLEVLSGSGSAFDASAGGAVAGYAHAMAALFDATTATGVAVTPLSTRFPSSLADVNDAFWAVGVQDSRKTTDAVLVRDGTMTKFSDLVVSGPSITKATAINNAGMIAGWAVGGLGFVGVPSESP